MMLRRRLIAAVALVLFVGGPLVMVTPLISQAATFTVTSTADAVDANPGDGMCDIGDGTCTLRAAIQEANATPGADTISVPAGTYILTLPGIEEDASASGDLDITDDLTINGAGANQTIINGNNLDRVFHLVTPHTAVITGLTVRGGSEWFGDGGGGILVSTGSLSLYSVFVTGNSAFVGGGIATSGTLSVFNSEITGNSSEGGGGLHVDGGTVSLSQVVVSGNSATHGGGIAVTGAGSVFGTNVSIRSNSAGFWGGGIAFESSGALSLDGFTVSQNHAWSEGGGIALWSGNLTLNDGAIENNSAAGAFSGVTPGGGLVVGGSGTISNTIIQGNRVYVYGGGLANFGQLTLVNTSVQFNVAVGGGGIYNEGSLAIEGSVIYGNSAENMGGGPVAEGGGILNRGILDTANVTVSGNTASVYSFIDGPYGGGISNRGIATLTNTTIANNRVDLGSIDPGGVDQVASNLVGYGTTSVVNTIIAHGVGADDCVISSNISLGNNIDSGSSCGFTDSTDQSNTNLLLGPLDDNGGNTLTHALLTGSPAIDRANDALCPATDQRGVERPLDGDGNGVAVCDIGAYEAPAIEVTDTTPPTIDPKDDIYVAATSTSGAVVIYDPPAYVDDVSGSGIATCAPPSGTQFPLGTTVVECTATDDAGNTATSTFNVHVVYAWSGVLPPLAGDTIVTVKANSIVPVKFRLVGASAGITDLDARLYYTKVGSGNGLTPASAPGASRPDNRFRAEGASGQYAFNWSTRGLSPGTYRLTIDLGDGQSRTVTVVLR